MSVSVFVSCSCVGVSDLDNESEPLAKRVERAKDFMIAVTSGAHSILSVLHTKL